MHPAFYGLVGLLAGALLAHALGSSWQGANLQAAERLRATAQREATVQRKAIERQRRERSTALARAAANQSAANSFPAASQDDMKRVFTASTGWGTAVQKAGVLAPELWKHGEPFWEAGLHEWLSDSVIGHGDDMPPPLAATDLPPQAHMCIVRVCPAYRMIFVRSSKTGSTSVYNTFGTSCRGAVSTRLKGDPACFWRGDKVFAAGPRLLGFDNWEQMWANYTVFTVVRNPFDRAGSGYDYVDSRRAKSKFQVEGRGRPIGCEMPSFARFLRQPWILGFQDILFECTDHSRLKQPLQLRTTDWYHIEPQSQCLFDSRENIVLDYILRLEHLEDDLPPLIEKINANRMPGVPVMKAEMKSINRGKLAKEAASSAEDEAAAEAASKLRHLKKYEDCGTRCFLLAQQYFAKDLRLLKFPTLPLNSTR